MAESKLSSVLPNNSIKGSMPRMPMSTVYVENSNNISSLEDIMYVNDVTLGFSNPNFGGNSIFRFSRTNQFLSHIIVRFKIQYVGDSSTIALSNANNNDFVAYNILRRVRWSVGNTELLSIDGENLVDIVMQQCESHMKKAKVLKYAGVKVNKPLADGNANSLAGPLTVEYEALIPCPWSSLCAINRIKPLPLHMLSEPVELQIELRDKTDVFTEGTDAGASVSLSAANLTYTYGKLGNPEQLKNQIYRWPFTSIFSHKFTIPNTAIGTKVSIDLNGFRKGEVKEIQFHAVTAGGIYDGLEIRDIRLLFNGQEIWRGTGASELWDLVYNNEPSIYGYREIADVNATQHIRTKNQLQSGVNAAGNLLAQQLSTANDRHVRFVGVLGGENSGFEEKYYYNIPIAEILDRYQKQGHYLSADFTKQTVQLEMDGLGAVGTLYVAYYYQGLYQFDGESALLVY